MEFRLNPETGIAEAWENGVKKGEIITMGNLIMEESRRKEQARQNYAPGVFDRFKAEDNLDKWQGFPELMTSMAFEMDCEHSFEDYRKNSSLKLKPAHSERDRKRNILYKNQRLK